MKTNIFRKVSLEKLSSPEQLDQLLKVTTPKSWIALFGLFGIIIASLIWGIFGSIPIKVNGQGILMKSGGLMNIHHVGSGTIQDIKVRPGDVIEKGTVVARVAQLSLVNEINENRIKLNELQAEKDLVEMYTSTNKDLRSKYLNQQTNNILEMIKNDKKQLEFLSSKIISLEELYKAGGITKQVLFDAKQEYEALKQNIANNQNKLKEINIQTLDVSKTTQRERSSIELNIEELKRKIVQLEQDIELNSNVVSPYSGRIIEVVVNVGMLINPYTTILSLEPIGKGIKNIESILYVPSTKGKNIQIGMNVQISPGTVEKEEYGFILGRVTFVSEYPSTTQGMVNILGNENLVASLLENGPVIEVRADLIPSSKTYSGYKWTSKSGAPVKIMSGTLCEGIVIEKKQRPISLVIPLVKKKLLSTDLKKEAAKK